MQGYPTQGRADHRDPEARRGRRIHGRAMPATQHHGQTYYRWKAKYGGTDSSDTAWHLIDEPGCFQHRLRMPACMLGVLEDSLFRRDGNDTWRGHALLRPCPRLAQGRGADEQQDRG